VSISLLRFLFSLVNSLLQWEKELNSFEEPVSEADVYALGEKKNDLEFSSAETGSSPEALSCLLFRPFGTPIARSTQDCEEAPSFADESSYSWQLMNSVILF